MLPGRGAGLQAVLGGKRGRRSLQASEALSVEASGGRGGGGVRAGAGEGAGFDNSLVGRFSL